MKGKKKKNQGRIQIPFVVNSSDGGERGWQTHGGMADSGGQPYHYHQWQRDGATAHGGGGGGE